MKKRMTEIKVRGPHEAVPVRIISDALIGTTVVGEGRMIPLVILDTSTRPDIEELGRVHEHLAPGDVKSVGAQLDGHKNKIDLVLTYIRPMELIDILRFEIARHG